MKRHNQTGEFCCQQPDGTVSDNALHKPILDNTATERAIADKAIARAMRRGLSRNEAEKLYGLPNGR
jgi:hypothetical protein